MKIKSYSLVETLVASSIFMIVVVVSLSSYAMIRKTNNQTDDARSTNQCARQLEDYIVSQVRSSNYDKRVMGIKAGGALEDIKETTTSYVGIALFKTENKLEAIYKSGDLYYTKEVLFTLLPNRVTLTPTIDTPLLTSDCNAFVVANVNFIVDPSKTFSTKKVVPFAGSTDPNSTVYLIVLEDALYRKSLETQNSAETRNSFARVYLKVSNNLGEI